MTVGPLSVLLSLFVSPISVSDHTVCLGSLPFPCSPRGPEQGGLGRCGACTVTQGPHLGDWWQGLWMAPGAAGTWTTPASWGGRRLGLPHTCSSSSFLPPTPTLPPRTPVSNPGWPSLLDGLRGAVGLLGKSSMQEACVLRLASVAQGVCASRRRPLWCPPFPVPTSCPPCAGGSTPGFPCSQQPLGTAVHPRVPLLSCGERGVEIYFLKFALNLRGSQDRWGLPRRELCHVCCPAVPRV